MTPAQMARIHQAAFVHERGWTADEFAALLRQPYIATFTTDAGFALTRTLVGETELITLAIAPTHQRRGIADSLIATWIDTVRPQAQTAFLEVAADNGAAIALYAKNSFAQTGLRKAYYARTDGTAADAVLMSRDITQG